MSHSESLSYDMLQYIVGISRLRNTSTNTLTCLRYAAAAAGAVKIKKRCN